MSSTKGGNIILSRVSAPDNVEPGESFTVEALVSNGAAYINPWDPDKCGLAPPGYTLEVVFSGPGGERTAGPACHTTTEIGTRDETYTATFTAPESGGTVDVEAEVVLPGSGKSTSAEGDTVTVTSTRPEEPEDPGSNSSGGSGGGGGGGGGMPNFSGSNPVDSLESGAAAIGAVAVLLLLVYAGTEGVSP